MEHRFCAVVACEAGRLWPARTLPALAAQTDCQALLVEPGEPAGPIPLGVGVVRAPDRPAPSFAEARNLGAAQAKAAWLVFLGPEVLAAPDLTLRLAPLARPGVFLRSEPGPDGRADALVVARADFEAIGGYDEALEGPATAQADLVERLELQGLAERSFPPGLLANLQGGERAAVDGPRDGAVEFLYRMAKTDLTRLGLALDLAMRRQLLADVRLACGGPGRPRTVKIIFRQQPFGEHAVAVSLAYEFPDAVQRE